MEIGNLEELKFCITNAKQNGLLYMGVAIKMPDLEKLEIIINPYDNFDRKLEYYTKAYNSNLELNTFNKIKIVGISVGDYADNIIAELLSLN